MYVPRNLEVVRGIIKQCNMCTRFKKIIVCSFQIEEEIQVPTPMKNAMAMNTLAPTGSIEEPQKNTGLMSDTTQQIA